MIITIAKNRYEKIKPNESKKDQIKDFFMMNPDNWLKSTELEYIFDYTAIRQTINQLRNEGLPIISDTRKGYKLTYNKDEVKKCYEELKQRALIALTAANRLKKYI